MVTINGATGVSMVQDGTVTDAKLNLTANSQEIKDALNAAGSAPIYACRAWVNFNGTGTVAIRSSGNVSSITDNGVGDYTTNILTAIIDADYAVIFGAEQYESTGANVAVGLRSEAAGGVSTLKTTTQFRILCQNSAGTNIDLATICPSVFR